MKLLGIQISRAQTPADLAAAETKRKLELRRDKALHEQGWHDLVGQMTAAGMRISEEGAMRMAAVYACVRVLAEGVAALPYKLYRRDGRARHEAPQHPLYRVLHDQGNDVMTSMELRELQMVHLALWGNFYGERQYDGGGNLVGIWPIDPWRVAVRRVQKGNRIALAYDVWQKDGQRVTLRSDQVFHLRGIGFDGIVGKSPIQMHRETLGTSAAAARFGARFFAHDTRSGLTLATDSILDDEAYERIRKEWEGKEGVDQAWKTKILEGGLKPEVLTMPLTDAQFIETLKYGRSEISGIFRVQPHLIGDLDRATYSNIEHQSLEHVQHTLRPWLVRIEQATSMQLLRPEERAEYYAAHVVDGILRGDIKSRYEAYAVGRNWGWLSANKVLELEDQNPIGPDGDVYLQPLNMVPAGSEFTEPTEQEPSQLGFDDSDRSARVGAQTRSLEGRSLPPRFRAAQALQPVFLDAFRRIVKREASEIRKAAKTYLEAEDVEGFRTWLADFVEEHAAWMEPRLLPVIEAMSEAMVSAAVDELGTDLAPEDLAGFALRYTQTAAHRYTHASRTQLEDVLDQAEAEELDPNGAVLERVDEWEGSSDAVARAEKLARRERQRSSNALTKAAWALAGIAVTIWRSVGSETCPYCTSMNGRQAPISGAFLGAGENISGLKVRSKIGHPPLHDGCDCIMMPGLRKRSRPTGAELRTILATILEPDDSHETD